MQDVNQKRKSGASEKENNAKPKRMDLDKLLVKELGQFGIFQARTVLVVALYVILLAFSAQEYIFTTARSETRCRILECETGNNDLEFAPDWIFNAIPASSDGFDNCQRFAANNAHDEDNATDVCPAALFDRENVVPCDEYVYNNTDTVVYDFDLGCDEWRRTLIGSVRTLGVLVAMAVVGVISDRWGRRTALVVTAFNTAFIGVLRYFAATYVGFIISEFAESALGGGGYSCAYILVLELTGPKYRVFINPMTGCFFAIGQALLALIAWAVPNWRTLTLTIYIPQFIALTFLWILPESVRWLMSKGRYDDAEVSLKNIARLNRKQLSSESLAALRNDAEADKRIETKTENSEPWLVILVFKHKPMLLRCVVTPVWWITLTFIFYGLTINAVNITGNSYLNFIAVVLIEIPGNVASIPAMNYLGRKPTLITAFWICGASQFAYLLMPNEQSALSLAVYLLAKWAIAVVATTVYTYTAELYPTSCRHRLFAFSSMLGRIGAVVAPLTPAFNDRLPFILFGSFALLAGALVFLTPETKGRRLPDTFEDISSNS